MDSLSFYTSFRLRTRPPQPRSPCPSCDPPRRGPSSSHPSSPRSLRARSRKAVRRWRPPGRRLSSSRGPLGRLEKRPFSASKCLKMPENGRKPGLSRAPRAAFWPVLGRRLERIYERSCSIASARPRRSECLKTALDFRRSPSMCLD